MKFDCAMQSEASECGHACLAMIATAHGLNTRLIDLRARFATSLRGSRLSDLISIANRMGLQSRALRLELEDLSRLRTPCVLHWDMDHFVVLRGVTRRGVRIADPATGDRFVNWSETSEKFTGVALELEPGANFARRDPAPRVRIRDLVGVLRGFWAAAGIVLALSLALQFFLLLSPLFLQWTIDQVLSSSDLRLLTVIGIAFLTVVMLQATINYLRGSVVIKLSAQISAQWLSNIFAHLLSLSISFFEKRHLGDILSRIGSATHIQRTLTTTFVEALIDGAMALLTLAMMLAYSIRLSLIALTSALIYMIVRAIVFRRFRLITEGQLNASAKLQTYVMESVRGVQTVKLTANEAFRKTTHNSLLAESVQRDADVAKMELGFNTTSGLIFGVERVLIVWLGAAFAINGDLSVGMLIAFLAYRELFSNKVSLLIERWIEFRMLGLQGERLADILLTRPEVTPDQEYLSDPFNDNGIVVKGLYFRFSDDSPWLIEDCSFRIEPGQSVAIVGPSGCGKTTLLKLLLGLLRPDKGVIKIGGRDIAQMHSEDVRGFVAAVMQEDQLFAGTVADNIALGLTSSLNMDTVIKAAKLAAIHDDIEAMPLRYRTLIGDMGSSLSGGQKQRIVLARALHREPSVLFLDEATSHLDVAAEQIVNDGIRNLNITRVIVAHRPSTIRSAETVLEMRDGSVRRVKSAVRGRSIDA